MNSYIPIALIGLSHKTASVEIRERVAFNTEEQQESIKILRETFDIDGCMILSTCNRTEVYICGEESIHEIPRIRMWLDEYKRTTYFQNDGLIYIHKGEEAVLHFFRVAAGLDSLVVGEPQITGQVKDAYQAAYELNSTNTLLNKLHNFALQAEKKVRTDTFLTDGAVSVSFAGVELARKIFSRLEDKNVLLIGAGETAELAALHFSEKGVQSFRVVNRTLSRAQELADRFRGTAYGLDQIPEAMQEVDIVISATASEEYVVTLALVESIIRHRYLKPLFLIDLAIPRDIDPNIDKLDGIYLYNIDDLEEIVKTKLEATECVEIHLLKSSAYAANILVALGMSCFRF
jgi:glutamyl-tRNA reductase